jgi:uncharacterized GH25 family protein
MLSRASLVVLLLSASSVAGTLRGTVEDRSGSPVAGAEVWVGRIAHQEPLQARRTTTDDQGRFAIEAEPGQWLAWARRGDEGTDVAFPARTEVPEGKDPKPVILRLRQKSHLRVRLLDAETGEPIAGGRLATDDARIFTADDQGRFEAPALTMTHHEAYPLCPGHERRRILFDTTLRPDAELEIRLPPAGKFVGRVIDEAGKPVPGATVGVNTSGTIISGLALWERCGPDGRFTWDGAPFGRTVQLAAQAPGFASQDGQGQVAVAGEPPPEIVFTLKRNPSARQRVRPPGAAVAQGRRDVSGIVTADGRPVEDALVRWGVDAVVGALETRTDARGRFQLRQVPEAESALAVIAPHRVPAFPVVPAGGDREVNVNLERGQTLRGRVSDDKGTPLEGVTVLPGVPTPHSRMRNGLALWEFVATTDARGQFAVEGMPADPQPNFTFFGERMTPVRDRVLEPGDGTQNPIVMLAEGAIRGRVVDPLGQPVPEFRVLLEIPEQNRPGDKVGGFFAGYGSPGVSFTSDDGTFLVSGLTAGNTQRVKVVAPGFGLGEKARVEASPLNHLPPAESLTVALGPPHALRVLAFHGEGKPIAGARVTLVARDPGPNPRGFAWGFIDAAWEEMVHGRTNAEGWAEFPALPFSKATVLVRAKGFARRLAAWRRDEPELTVDLEPESVLAGEVRDARGRPFVNVRVYLHSATMGDSINTTTDGAGRYIIAELPPGKYAVSAIPAGAVRQLDSEEIALEPGKTHTKDIDLPDPGGPP